MLGRSVGLQDNEMAALRNWQDSDLFDEKDRTVLAYTDNLSKHNKVSDELHQALTKHFSTAEIMKLCVTVSFAGLVNRVHATFLTDVDQLTLDSVEDAPFCLIHSQ